MTDWTDVAGVIHVHTTYSGDSSATLDHIDRSALWGRADFVIVTDHNSMGLKGQEGWRDGYLLLVGHEVTPPRGDHYLALKVDSLVDPQGGPQRVVDDVRSMGGLGFIEHPFFEGNLSFKASESPWRDWSVTGYTGMSIFNFTTDWGVRLTPIKYMFFRAFPFLAVDVPNRRTLKKWDEINRERKVVGIGTMDAHRWTKNVKGQEVEALPFRYYFRSIRTHLMLPMGLTGDFQVDASMVYEALENGRCYVANDYLADAKGFLFRTSTGVTMGSDVNGPVTLEVVSPLWGRIRLLKDGTVVKVKWGKWLRYPEATSGAYRVEVSIWHKCRFKNWIFSNPIYVR